MKNNAIIITLILLLLVFLIIFFEEINNSVKEQSDVEKFTELVINGGTKEQLEKITGAEVMTVTIMTGPDSYLNSLIEEKNLEEYTETGKELIKNFEKIVKQSFDYDIENKAINKAFITYKMFYYAAYISDLKLLKETILKSTLSSDEISEYKAIVIAMKILDKHLNEYQGNKKYIFYLNYEKANYDTYKNTYNSYLNNLVGFYNGNQEVNNLRETSADRVEEYLLTAKANNIVDSENLLKMI